MSSISINSQRLITLMKQPGINSELDSSCCDVRKKCNDSFQEINLDVVLEELNIERSMLSDHFIDVEDCEKKYTLMQFAVKNGLTKFVKTLLRNDVDPNFSGEKPDGVS